MQTNDYFYRQILKNVRSEKIFAMECCKERSKIQMANERSDNPKSTRQMKDLIIQNPQGK